MPELVHLEHFPEHIFCVVGVGKEPFADDAGFELCFKLFPDACSIFMPNFLVGTSVVRARLVGEHKASTVKEQFSDCSSVFSVLVVVLVRRLELEKRPYHELRESLWRHAVRVVARSKGEGRCCGPHAHGSFEHTFEVCETYIL